MKLKRIIALLVLVVTVFNLTGCLTIFGTEVTIDCVTYNTNGKGGCRIKDIDTRGTDDTLERIYVRDEINGKKVVGAGEGYFPRLNVLTVKNTERIYFPWSFEGSHINFSALEKKIKYALHPRYDSFHLRRSSNANNIIFVIPKVAYDKGGFGSKIVIPANIVFFFNYNDNPNGGYFLVDIQEKTGKILKPPYDPKREGYTFTGWYKDKECSERWDFDNDIITINFDEEGNRIFEELCLYAGWSKK